MKKKVWLFVLACICCIAFAVAGCADKAENISLSITNKEALTAEWLEEGENRTVELSITPEKYTVNNSEVVVTSDNSEVVKADGLTLLATGGGTANITVSLGKASDTVAITVTPKLRGVSITNKAELSEVWGLGDTDRTLDVAKLFKNSTAPLTASDVTVTSSAPEIIEADGFALKTKAIGDAEITVAYGDFTDKVSLSVVSALETFGITNKEELANLALGTTYDLSSYVTFSPLLYTAENTRPVITCEPAGIIEQVEGYQIKAASNGSSTVTVTVRGKSDTFSVSVELGTPKITFDVDEVGARFEETDEGGILSVLQTGYYNELSDVVLPAVYATTSDGNYINDIVIKKGGDVITKDTVQLTIGRHELTYSVADPRDESKVATKTLIINVYRRVMQAGDKSDVKVTDETRYLSDDKQEFTTKTSGVLKGAFNIAPSKLYYAEVTFVVPTTQVFVGLGHFVGEETNRCFTIAVSRNTGVICVKDNKPNTGNIYENDIVQYNVNTKTNLKDKDGYVFPAIPSTVDGAKVKLAIARDGNKFYLFMNDVLLEERDITDVDNGHYLDASVPGISGQWLDKTTMTNIVFMSGEDATSKLAGLIPTPTINNKSAFSNPIDQNFKGKVEVSIAPEYYIGNTKVTYTSDNESAVTVGADGTVTPKANGEATITVAIGDKTDTVKITVELKADTPVLTLTPPATAENVKYTATEAGATLDVVQTGRYNENTTVTLPQFSAILGEADISGDVSVTLDGKSTTLTGNTVTLANGTHTIIYTATNPENNKSATKTLTINIARKVMKDGTSFKVTDETLYSGDADQVVTATKNDVQGGAFNIAPSKLYYAEATFVFNTADQLWIGLGHFVGNETDASRWMSCGVSRKSGAVCVKDRTAQTAGLYDKPFDGTLYNVKDRTTLTEQNGFLFPLDGTTMKAGDKVKLAIARDGNTFYFFMNDVLFEARDMSTYADSYYLADTAPGFSGNDLNKTSITNIVFMDGGEATEKINALTQTTQGDSETQNAAPAEQAVIPKKEEE